MAATQHRRSSQPRRFVPSVLYLLLVFAVGGFGVLWFTQERKALSLVDTKLLEMNPLHFSGDENENKDALLEEYLVMDEDVLERAMWEQKIFCESLAVGSIRPPWMTKSDDPSSSEQAKVIQVAIRPVRFQGNSNLQGLGHDGFTIALYEKDDIVSHSIITSNSWEGHLLEQMAMEMYDYAASAKNNLSPSNVTFMDIGANMGWFSLSMAAMGFKVIAFEPLPVNLYLLRSSLCHPDNAALARRVTVVSRGLSSTAQTCWMVSVKSNVGNGVVQCDSDFETLKTNNEVDVRGKLELMRLDDILKKPTRLQMQTKPTELLHKVAAVKIDVEGHEPSVFEGGSNIFFAASNKKKIPWIHMEFAPHGNIIVPASVEASRNMMERLFNAGYQLQKIYGGHYHGTKLTREESLNMANFPGLYDLVFQHTMDDIALSPPPVHQ